MSRYADCSSPMNARWACMPMLACLFSTCVLLVLSGCGRSFYREQADHEVYDLVDCAATKTRWSLDDFGIEPGPESRMHDPNSPDCPPMPPDDPASHELMQCVDCKKGSPCWKHYGRTPWVENPNWAAYLPYDANGNVALDRQAAVELALTHSPEYQRELEDLYLAALAVTLERFRFDVQFFGGNGTNFTSEGPTRSGDNILRTDTDMRISKLCATGGELVTEVANSLVWQFAGPDTYSANTLLSFSLVQPLLRGAGRAVVLEELTDSERALLAEIRDLERFRRTFYTEIVIAYMRLLQNQVEIRNQEFNIVGLRQGLDQLEAAFDAGYISGYNVGLTQQGLYSAQSGLLSQNASNEAQLDAFRVSLGLPPDLATQIVDGTLLQFDLIDPALTEIREGVADFRTYLSDASLAATIDPNVFYRQTALTLRPRIEHHFLRIRQDVSSLEQVLPARRQELQRLSMRPEVQNREIDPRICDVAQLDDRFGKMNIEFANVSARINDLLEQIEAFPFQTLTELAKADLPPEQLREAIQAEDAPHARLVELIDALMIQLLELQLIQAQARLDAIMLTPVRLSAEEALAIARENRRDWMNARADLVDSWRQIEVQANRLESDLDLTFSGDINTTDNDPLRFSDATGRLRVGVRFDAPLTRLAERNIYRRALIDYQRARRAYYTFEDSVNRTLRDEIRSIRLNDLDFEVLRASVFVAIDQVNRANRTITAPPPPGQAPKLGDNTARDLVQALDQLLRAQNNFVRIWVDQEIERMNLDRDLGTMDLDERGLWVDPGVIGEAALQELPIGMDTEPLPPLPGQAPIPAPVQPPAIPPGPTPAPIPAVPEGPLQLRAPRGVPSEIQPVGYFTPQRHDQPPLIMRLPPVKAR